MEHSAQNLADTISRHNDASPFDRFEFTHDQLRTLANYLVKTGQLIDPEPWIDQFYVE